MAKALIPELMEQLERAADLPNLELEVLTPTATMPLGANNAACIVVMCSSFSQASSLSTALDRLLRKTMQPAGSLGQPPTQLVGISTLGTERTDKFPYSMQNMMGGKLDQRRQIEEVLINTVRSRVTEPPMDFSIIKVGEFKKNDGSLTIQPGDSIDVGTTPQAAASVVVQSIAYQPFARNSTLAVAGTLGASMDQNDWDSLFLPLEGPEVYRLDKVGSVSQFDQLVEYLREWSDLLSTSGKGLTTPVLSSYGIVSMSSHLVAKQDGVQLLFLPTNTGKNYLSKDEERRIESGGGGNSRTSTRTQTLKRDGGLDVVVEVVDVDQGLRVRARRCNYADDAVIKELSEATILKRLEKAMEVWSNEHK